MIDGGANVFEGQIKWYHKNSQIANKTLQFNHYFYIVYIKVVSS